MSDEPRQVELVLGDQIEERRDVAVRSPAHVSDRVVLAAGDVVLVVHPGAHRAAEPEIDLLAEVGAPVELDLGVAEADHPAAVAHQQRRHLDRLVAGGGGGEQHRVHSLPAADPKRMGQRLLVLGRACGLGAVLERERALGRIEIHSDHAAAVGAAQLHQELAEQAEPDDRDALAELEPRLTHRLERDRADRAGAGRFEAHPGRHRHHEVARHRVVLGVRRQPLADAGHPVADRELIDLRAHLDHRAGAAVAQHRGGLQAFLHLAHGGHQSLLAERLQHLPHLVRALPCLLGEVHARLGDFHLLGPDAHERVVRPHQHVTRPDRRHRNFARFERAVAQELANLLHGVPSGVDGLGRPWNSGNEPRGMETERI